MDKRLEEEVDVGSVDEPIDDTGSPEEIEMDDLQESCVNTVEDVVRSMKAPFSMSICSKRNSGKSFLVRNLVYELAKQKKINQVIVMSNTSGLSLNKDYDYMPKKLLTTYKESTITKLLEVQAKDIKRGKIREVLLIMDDCIGETKDKSGEGSRMIRSLYANSRHYHVSVILLSQIANRLLTPAIKENSDYLFFSRINRKGLESIWESICNIDKKDFIAFAEKSNKDYSFILYDNTTQSNKPEDFLFIVRAEQKQFLLNGK
jgi:hypothetical protein